MHGSVIKEGNANMARMRYQFLPPRNWFFIKQCSQICGGPREKGVYSQYGYALCAYYYKKQLILDFPSSAFSYQKSGRRWAAILLAALDDAIILTSHDVITISVF